MCGIYASISVAPNPEASTDLYRCLNKRGPDHTGTVTVELADDGRRLFVTLTSTVLALRGDHVAEQPLVDSATGSVLCWNGEAWKIRGEPVNGNDGEAVLRLLASASLSQSSQSAVIEALRSIEGPFAFVYLDKRAGRMYYGRDRLGRRSLLSQQGETFTLSSIADTPANGWQEVEAEGIYDLSLSQCSLPATLTAARHHWAVDESLVLGIGSFNTTITHAQSVVAALSTGMSAVQLLRRYLIKSLHSRVMNVPLPPGANPSDARVAILFSGGLDCTVLARLSSDLIPSNQAIDLINVAFENPRIAQQHKGDQTVNLYELCPDRITGRKSFAELAAVCPERHWRFVTVNVPYSDTRSHRDELVRLIHPHNTEMDLSIAYALYFAARGQGFGQCPGGDLMPYDTTARVLLSGLGADELFGGYVRHATAFSRKGFQGLVDELQLDVSRLGKRNLGRDDRVMTHWGREVRFPFLDECLVKWAIELPAWEKCDFSRPDCGDEIEPGKRILRLLAADLDMVLVAKEKKRAIQFGARTAKMESGKVKGTTLIES